LSIISNYFAQLTIIECKKVIQDQSQQGWMRKVTHTVFMAAVMEFLS